MFITFSTFFLILNEIIVLKQNSSKLFCLENDIVDNIGRMQGVLYV